MKKSKSNKSADRATNAVVRRIEKRVAGIIESPDYTPEAIANCGDPKQRQKAFCREVCGAVLDELAQHIAREAAKEAAARIEHEKRKGGLLHK